MSGSNEQETLNALAEALSCDLPGGHQVQEACEGVLAALGERAHPALLAALKKPNLRLPALRVLAQGSLPNRSSAITSAAREALGDPSADARLAALRVLAASQDSQHVKRIGDLLDPKREQAEAVRAKAAWALGALSAKGKVSEPVQSRLVSALASDPSPVVRKEAALALGQTLERANPRTKKKR